MTINLRDLRTAVRDYLDSKVTVTISAPTSTSGSNVIPSHAVFTFSITAQNAASPDGIRLVNVRYHLRTLNPAAAKLVVPATNPDVNGIRYKGLLHQPVLAFFDLIPNTEHDETFLFPPASPVGTTLPIDRAGDLDVGDSDTISGIKGKTGVGGGVEGAVSGTITCRVIAEPDLDFLFPKNEDTATASKTFLVFGA
jgi:hypothetical protein